MKITTKWITNIKVSEVLREVDRASKQGMVDSITAIANDVIRGSPWKTGHNRRSIAYKLDNKVTKKGKPRGSEKPFVDWEPDTKTLEGAIYSTSGYGGILETGSRFMPARPYFKPALDKNIKNLPKNIKAELD